MKTSFIYKIRPKLFIFVVCLTLTSCSFLKGQGVIDVGLDETFTINLDDEQAGFGAIRMPKMARWYQVSWGALTVADLYVVILPTKEGYGMRTIIQSRGLAKVISGFKSNSGATMRFEAPDKYSPIRFKTAFEYRDKKRRIDISWDKGGRVVKESNQPPENRYKRPAVSDNAKVNAFDPLTIVMAARSEIRSSIRKGIKSFSLPMYDGRRRANILYTIHGADKNGNIHVSFIDKPVEGYTNNELEKIEEWDKKFRIVLSPKDLLPIAGKGQSVVGEAFVRLKKECDTLAECMNESN